MPKVKQSGPVVLDLSHEGCFLNGYTYVFYAADVQDRPRCEDEMFTYLEKRSEKFPGFKACVWRHFDDPDPCGKHNVTGDHYHVITSKQHPKSGEACFTPMSSAFGGWIRTHRKSGSNQTATRDPGRELGSGDWLEGPNGITVFKPSGLFRYLRIAPRELCFFTQNVESHLFKKGNNTYMHHLPIVKGEPLPEVPGLDENGSPQSAIFNTGNAKSKTAQYLFGLMSLIQKSKCSTIEQFQVWALAQGVDEASRILEKYVSRSNFNQTFAKALEWYTADHANQPWKKQAESIMLPQGMLFMSVERSLEMFDLICKWNHFDRMEFIGDCLDVVKKSKQKVNTLLFIGSSNAGKSQLAQSLALTFSKVARIYQGQNNNFIFQSAIGRGIILHQEALFAKPSYEVFKLVMEGALTEVAVKGKPNVLLPRIPYVITCNVIPWAMADPADARAFENRCLKYEFQCCPRLKDFRNDGEMNPEMWLILAKEYDDYMKELNLICDEVMAVETRAEAAKRPLVDEPTLTPEQHAVLSDDVTTSVLYDDETGEEPPMKKHKC